ncbi:hypothetical protein GCK32_005559 [Trichostrongylus colubriformis]|uniref:Uncharacterized protein n=1 Tax=Trichostrongylus colubriformis TaxID=6319 RepID=A0AAN8GBQ0_TRICO
MYEDKQTAFIDVALTLRAGGCTYMIVLAMYLNTLLFAALHYKVIQIRRLYRMATPSVTTPMAPSETKIEEQKPEKPLEAFMKFDEQKTQEQEKEEEAKEPEKPEKPEKKSSEKSKDKTLRSARMSIRLPRAPKGHHVEELDQMEKFLAEDDPSDMGKI